MPTVSGTVTDKSGNVATWSTSWTVGTPPPTTGPLMGCSNSSNDHGGTEAWDSWRCYTEGSMLSLANRTGTTRPKALLYSKGGSNLGGTNPVYATVYNEVLADLNDFYYNGTGSTQSARWGIKLYWSNGNEMHDKGALAISSSAGANPHSAAQIAAYGVSQKALYDACHYAPGGVRRFPDAYAGSDPTTEAERNGWVEDWLHPSAQWHDFVAWSIYPAGRKDSVSDPVFNWPSLVEVDWNDAPDGYMVRCFRRNRLAGLAAGKVLELHVGETGTGDDPDDSTTRPYWAVHGFMHSLMTISTNLGIPVGTVNWWDNELSGGPQNILTDEPATTNPSTRVVWQGWQGYCHQRGGTHPASWSSNPKTGWKTTGAVV